MSVNQVLFQRILMIKLRCFFILLITGLISCGKNDNRTVLAKRLMELEGNLEEPERIRELKFKIRAVDSEVEKTLELVEDKATYWRLLGLKYMDYKMWGKAAEAFDEAIELTPDHAVLLYRKALCIGQLSLSIADEELKRKYMEEARNGYQRVLAIDPRYTPAMYALAVIYVFETGEYLKAAELLNNLLKIERSDIQARFLLARSLMEIGKTADALDVYSDIVRSAERDSDKKKAEDLYKRILEDADGN